MEVLPRGCDRTRLHPPVDGAAIDRMSEQMRDFFGLYLDRLDEAEELRKANHALDRLLGRIDDEDYLDKIFLSFCIGK